MIGLKRGNIQLLDHQKAWEENAQETIYKLKNILGDIAIDIQHIGSTSIIHIKAKPVIDIAVKVNDFSEVLSLTPILESNGFIFRGYEGEERQPVYQCGEYIKGENDMRLLTHYIHIVKANSQQWCNYINLRDYLNANISVAKKYEELKLRLAEENKEDGNLKNYHKGKQDFISQLIIEANKWDESGRMMKDL